MRQGGYCESLSETTRSVAFGAMLKQPEWRGGVATMLVSASTTFAIRCPRCGKLELASVSRFEFSRGRSVKVACSCGGHTLTAGTKRGQVFVQVPCYLCDGVHFLYYSPRQFWNAKLEEVSCVETSLQLGVFGAFSDVEQYARPGGSELERLLEDAAFDDYFDHREVMYQMLARIHTLAEAGNVTCVCGNHKLSIDIYPDRLDLTCEDCGRHKAVAAGSDADLAELERTARIEVGGDTPGRRKGHKK